MNKKQHETSIKRATTVSYKKGISDVMMMVDKLIAHHDKVHQDSSQPLEVRQNFASKYNVLCDLRVKVQKLLEINRVL